MFNSERPTNEQLGIDNDHEAYCDMMDSGRNDLDWAIEEARWEMKRMGDANERSARNRRLEARKVWLLILEMNIQHALTSYKF